MTVYYAGVDPGLSGAVAVLRVTDGAQRPTLEGVWALPVYHKVVSGKERRRYDLAKVLQLAQAVAIYEPRACAIEDVHGRGGQVGSSAMGFGVGMLNMAFEAAKVPVHLVGAATWKAALRCPASKPRAARLAGTMIFGTEGKFSGPKGGLLDGHAEAALLAYYAWTRFGRG